MSRPRPTKPTTSNQNPLPPPGNPKQHGKAYCPFILPLKEFNPPPNPTLANLVNIYIKDGFRDHFERVLDIFRNCGFDTAVECAGLAQCPVCHHVYPHQYRIIRTARPAFSQALVKAKAKLKAARDFEALLDIVAKIADNTRGIGEITAYDAALRIAANLGILPNAMVYAYRGATIYERTPHPRAVPITDFRPEVTAKLNAYQIEDFLCVCHKKRYDDTQKRTLVPVLK